MPIRAFLATFAIGAMMTNAPGAFAAELENTLYMNLKDGRVVIQMLPEVAPKHVDRIKELVRTNFYDGLTFHRVIAGFMAQTGDPKGDGTGGSGTKLPAEFSDTLFVRGTLGMARSQDPNSADSQFFIMFAPAPHLNGQYTVWGNVVDGMEYVDQIKKGNARSNGTVESPDRIISMELASDANP
jgi:peptidylprolyl isomerase